MQFFSKLKKVNKIKIWIKYILYRMQNYIFYNKIAKKKLIDVKKLIFL